MFGSAIYPLVFVLVLTVQRTSCREISKQPYGPLMCQDLALTYANKTGLFKYDPLHLVCRIREPVSSPKPVPKNVDVQMRCLMCTKIPFHYIKDQVCQVINGNIICALTYETTSCVYTTNVNGTTNRLGKLRAGHYCESRACMRKLKQYLKMEADEVVFVKENHICSLTRWPETYKKDEIISRKKRPCIMHNLRGICENGKMEKLQSIIFKNLDSINCKLGTRTLIMVLADNGHEEMIDMMIALGADLSAENKVGTVLHHASATPNSVNTVRKLVQLGMDVDRESSLGYPPLLGAVTNGCLDSFDYLVSSGCNVTAVNRNKKNALYFAKQYSRTAIIERIKELRLPLN